MHSRTRELPGRGRAAATPSKAEVPEVLGFDGQAGAAAEPGSAQWWADRVAAESRRRPRAGGLSTARIVEAALEVLREDGVDALTVRNVAARLHTRSASLYRHIAGRDELIALIADHVMGDIHIVGTGCGWRADVEALMYEMRRVMLSQPLPSSAARTTAGSYGPNTLRVIDAALRLFLQAGMNSRNAAYTATAMLHFVAGTAGIQRSAVGRGPHGATRSAGFTRLLDSLPADNYTALRAAGADYVATPADEVFAHSVAIFLDGVESRLPRVSGADSE